MGKQKPRKSGVFVCVDCLWKFETSVCHATHCIPFGRIAWNFSKDAAEGTDCGAFDI
jgi:hypothetical protein